MFLTVNLLVEFKCHHPAVIVPPNNGKGELINKDLADEIVGWVKAQ